MGPVISFKLAHINFKNKPTGRKKPELWGGSRIQKDQTRLARRSERRLGKDGESQGYGVLGF